jgi:hypothetical protein
VSPNDVRHVKTVDLAAGLRGSFVNLDKRPAHLRMAFQRAAHGFLLQGLGNKYGWHYPV